MTPEKRIQNALINYLKTLTLKYPIYVERRQAGGFSYKKGQADIYFVFNGIHVELEVKAENGQLSSMQQKWRDMCIKNNILWICAQNVDEFKAFMSEHFSEFC